MILRLPRDFESYNCFRKLVRALGSEEEATYLFMRLWVDLGYQVDVHGKVGVFERSEVETFLRSVHLECERPLIEILTEAKLLIDRGAEFFCPLFAYKNPELDAEYLAPDFKGRVASRFVKKKEAAEKRSAGILSQLKPECWFKENDERILPSEMNRVIVAIKIVDSVLQLTVRSPSDFEVGLIQDAYRVISEFSEEKLMVVLKRLYLRRNTPGLPKQTAQIFRRFHDVMALVMPEDGWMKWASERGYEKAKKGSSEK